MQFSCKNREKSMQKPCHCNLVRFLLYLYCGLAEIPFIFNGRHIIVSTPPPFKIFIVEVKNVNIIEKNLSDIKPYEKNPRKNDHAVEHVANSIKEFGFKVPIVIDKNGVIVAGHTRYKASKKLGLEKVPCIIADDLSPEQIKAYRLADNKVSEKSEWDFDLLNAELSEILNIDMEMFDFNVNDVFEPIADDEDMQDKPLRFEHTLSIDKIKIILTEEEYDLIIDKYNSYVDDNGVSFGFVRSVFE